MWNIPVDSGKAWSAVPFPDFPGLPAAKAVQRQNDCRPPVPSAYLSQIPLADDFPLSVLSIAAAKILLSLPDDNCLCQGWHCP